MRRGRLLLIATIAGLVLTGCGVPLQNEPEPLPSDLVPTSLHVETATAPSS